MSELRKSFLKAVSPQNDGGGGFGGFDDAAPAADFGILPPGKYVAVAIEGKATSGAEKQHGKDCFSVRFKILDGEYRNRQLSRYWYFTLDALPYTKRDLDLFGIRSSAQIKATPPFTPDRLVFELTVTVRKLDDGTERNDVRSIKFVRTIEPEANPFPPRGEGE